MTRIGLYPGTFDPLTFGHLDIIQRGARLVDRLIIGVAMNEEKKPLFSLEERVDMLRYALSDQTGAFEKIEVRPFETLLVQFAREVRADIIIRGLRNVTDFDYESQMLSVNRHMNPDMETIFLFSDVKTQLISSRLVKEVARLQGDVSCFVPLFVAQKLKNKLS